MRLGNQLLLLSLGVLALPWLGYRYVDDIQSFLIEGQEQAQQLAAEAIAISLQNRPELLASGAAPKAGTRAPLYAYPSDRHLLIDGYDDDWEPRIVPVPLTLAEGEVRARLRVLQQEQFLHLMVEVDDPQRLYRNPGLLRLNSSDQLRLTIPTATGVLRLVLAPEAAGSFRPLVADHRWRRVLDESPDPAIEAAWQQSVEGYRVEVRLPVALFDASQALSLTVVDVDDPLERQVSGLVSLGQHPTPLNLHSPELQRLVRGLRRSDRHLWIVDRQGLTRAVSNIRDAHPGKPAHQRAMNKALQGEPQVQRYVSQQDELILAAHPIVHPVEGVIGAVLVEVDTRRIDDLKRMTLLKTAGATALVIGLLLTGLLLFSYRLTRRIAGLRRETRASIDAQGRVVARSLTRELLAGDQIGDLARDISAMLGRLHHYTRFLERMPRTLRHEMNNPLNTISTSLEMLALEGGDRATYLQSAQRGVARLGLIISTLTEAASLEESLLSERREPLDLNGLLARYIGHLQAVVSDRRFRFNATANPVWVLGSELRLEQMLDKLLDNARDFSAEGECIEASLRLQGGDCILGIANPGPPIPADLTASLFDSLVSHRRSQTSSGADVHLGIGLYVVQLIAGFHGGQASCRNIGGGVLFEVRLPLDTEVARPGDPVG